MIFPTKPLLLALAAALSVLAPAAHAQSLVFEEVGDRPLGANDLAFDDAGALWAIIGDIWRLPPGGDTWEEVNSIASVHLLTLGLDTLLTGGSGNIGLSVDGGQTFVAAFTDGGERLFALPSGTLLAGADAPGSVLRSTDRGATWAFADFDPPGTWVPFGEAFVGVPPGFPHTGRVAGAFWAGMAYSDDDGASWEASNVFQNDGRYSGWDMAVGVDGRVYAAFYEQWVEGLQVAVSEDGGRTYAAPYYFGEYRGVGVRIITLPGGANPELGVLLVIEHEGQVSRSDDGGVTWLQVGQVPRADLSHAVVDAAVGPDGRLYAAVRRGGANRAWVYRSEGPVVSAAVSVEAEPLGGPVEIGPEGGSFPFRVRLTNQTTQPMTFEGWSAVGGPVSREPVVGPQSVTLMPGQTLGRTVTQQVPGRAPAGTYTYTVRAGALGGAVLSEASFTFEKAAGAVQSVGVEDWTASGWAETEAADAPPGVQLSVSPNPSRGAATVALSLPAPAEATVSIYDALGRRVALLHEGPLAAGHHAFALDGAALPPGLYVVRVAVEGGTASRRVTLLR